MKTFLRVFLIAFLVSLNLLQTTTLAFASETTVITAQKTSSNAHLVVQPFKPFVVGIHPTITVQLTGQYNKPLPHQVVRVFIDGHRKAQAQTDNNGVASIVLQYVL